MPFSQFPTFFCRIGNKFLETIGIKTRTERKPIVISSPYDFKEGPSVNFPGYSQDDISLMKEKAIASTAVTEYGEYDFADRRRSRPHSRAGSTSCGIGKQVVYHARRVSRGCLQH
ncbi:hypothetical protein BJ875DRAFT_256670 [Amylocarpus encephaloides]|uniref:Uncharacterized protein n=1 Tax=Amylocarpus encephaloides TaxID=45428 RepID=A0A9P7YL59_9HELO|nr:hypothetical protein BJ875DRAFT_256670 [Amylocarpus encephaloides]